jgi:hypothetical protein
MIDLDEIQALIPEDRAELATMRGRIAELEAALKEANRMAERAHVLGMEVEREACAQIAEGVERDDAGAIFDPETTRDIELSEAIRSAIAAAIRARAA